MNNEKRISVSLTYAEWQSVTDALDLSIANKKDLIATITESNIGTASERDDFARYSSNEAKRMQSAKSEIKRAMLR